MIIGVPKEIKDMEGRVSITPAGARILTRMSHVVLVESGAGVECGYSDEEYLAAGARTTGDHLQVYQMADLVLKVKEPLPEEYDMLKDGQTLFAYLHLAADRELAGVLMDKKVLGIAYETVELQDGTLPLLVPMSEIAGKMSVQIGASLLEKARGGKGILLGGVPGVAPGVVVILGAGTAGANAARIAVGLGADVWVLDVNSSRLRYLDDIFGGRIKTLASNEYNVEHAVEQADLLIGAVLVAGYKAPKVVSEDSVKRMSPGSVIVDIAIDQGGCIETVDRVTTHSHPTYVKHGIVHYSVANIPGAVPRTATMALTSATFPYILELVKKGCPTAILENQALRRGINTLQGSITNQGVAESLGMPYYPLEELLK